MAPAKAAPAREFTADLVIIGGGTGGTAAALAAASTGTRVIITEQTDWLGGQLTAQAVPPDENEWIEQFGCTRRYRAFREGIRAFYREHYPLLPSARNNPHLNPGGGYVSRLCYEPQIGRIVLEQMLAWPRARGFIRVLPHRVPVSADVDGDHVRAVTVRHLLTGEQTALIAPYFIDATELGDVLPLAGVEYVVGSESQNDTGEPHAVKGPPQPDNVEAITWCFPMAWDTAPRADHTIPKPRQYNRWRRYVPQTDPPWGSNLLSWEFTDPKSGEMFDCALFTTGRHKKAWLRGLWEYRQIVCAQHYPDSDLPDEVTLVNWPQNDYFVRNPIDTPLEERDGIFEEARQLSLSLLYWIQTEAPRHDGGTAYPEMYLVPELTGTPDGLAKYAYIRESRRIRAEFTVTENHVSLQARKNKPAEHFGDSVGIGHYNIDLHPTTDGVTNVAMQTRPFQIPLGSLLPVRMRNLLPGCKNIGVTHVTNGCYRLHPIEWNIGESAGLLAAFCLRRNAHPKAVRAKPALLADFQKLLTEQGVELEWPSGVR